VSQLRSLRFVVATLHGGAEQDEREFAVDEFMSGERPILVATSVAARGLDVQELRLVVNYDCPTHTEDYVHRVGRTGRAGTEGVAHTFLVQGADDQYAPDLIRCLRASQVDIPPQLQELADSYKARKAAGQLVPIHGSGFGGRGYSFTREETRAVKARRIESLQPTQENSEQPTPAKTGKEVATVGGSTAAKATTSGSTSSTPIPSSTAADGQDEAEGVVDRRGDVTTIIFYNDYPTSVRRAMASAPTHVKWQREFDVRVAMRGLYIPPNTPMPANDRRRLHLLLQGTSVNAVTAARAAILDFLQRLASKASTSYRVT
jgi:ATP-dependent RNA helicase DDX46/PRP5